MHLQMLMKEVVRHIQTAPNTHTWSPFDYNLLRKAARDIIHGRLSTHYLARYKVRSKTAGITWRAYFRDLSAVIAVQGWQVQQRCCQG